MRRIRLAAAAGVGAAGRDGRCASGLGRPAAIAPSGRRSAATSGAGGMSRRGRDWPGSRRDGRRTARSATTSATASRGWAMSGRRSRPGRGSTMPRPSPAWRPSAWRGGPCETHRFAEAEVLMPRALGDRGRHAIEARETLVNLFKIQGRYREAERLVRDGADRYPDKIGLLKELAQLGSINPHKLDLVRAGLEKAASASPDDDRVWLGWANLATRTGRYEEAAGWLDRCRATPRRPGGLARPARAGDGDGRRGRVAGRPAPPAGRGASSPPRCSSCAPGSRPPPATPIERSRPCGGWWRDPPITCGPWSDSRSSLFLAGRAEESARLRARKAELDRAKAQYEILLFRPDAASRPAPIARLAEALGRRLEARILWTMAVGTRSARPRGGRGPRPTRDDVRRARSCVRRRDPRRPARRSGTGRPDRRARADGLSGGDPGLPRRRRGRRAALRLRQRGRTVPTAPRDDERRRRPARLRRRRLARRLLRPGRAVPAAGTGVRPTATGCSATGATARSRTRAARSGIAAIRRRLRPRRRRRRLDNDGRSRPLRHPMAGLCPLSQPGGRHVRGRHGGVRAWAATATGRPRPPSPTSTATATSTCTSAITSSGTPSTRRSAGTPRKGTPVYCGPPRFPSLPDHVFRNDGGRFVDVTAEAGIVDRHGQGLGVVGLRLRRRRAHRPVRRQRSIGQFPLPQPGRVPVRGSRRGLGRRAAAGTACTRRAWGSPAATSTATAGPTWP